MNLPTTNNLSGLSDIGDIVYYRSDDRVSPHNVFTNYQMLQDGIDALQYSRDYAPPTQATISSPRRVRR